MRGDEMRHPRLKVPLAGMGQARNMPRRARLSFCLTPAGYTWFHSWAKGQLIGPVRGLAVSVPNPRAIVLIALT
jgi:hypothetical protein